MLAPRPLFGIRAPGVPHEHASRSRFWYFAANVYLLAVFAIFAGGVLLRLPAFGRLLLSDDEAIYATTADALTRGALLYRDVVDHKPPLIYHVYQAGFSLLGPYNVHGAHALVLVAVLFTAGVLFAIVREHSRTSWSNPAKSSEFAGLYEPAKSSEFAIAALAAPALFLIFSTTWHDYDALAANCELFLLAPQTLAAWMLLRAVNSSATRTRTAVTHVMVGVLVGTSALFKYQGVTFLGASFGLLGWYALLRRTTWRFAGAMALSQFLGVVIPPAVYLWWCAASGNAAAAVYWFQFNFSYVGAGLTGAAAVQRGLSRLALIGGVAAVPYVLGMANAVSTLAGVARVIRRRTPDAAARPDLPSCVSVLASLWLATSAIAVTAGGRYFGHYFQLCLPPLCVLAAPSFERLWNQGSARRLPLIALCAIPAFSFFSLATFARPLAAALDEGEPPYDEVAARIASITTARDSIFVWGNSPQLYILARRSLGTRFSFCNYMTGESPGTPTETGARDADVNQLPASWQMLFEDLDRRRPALFVDAAAAGWDGYEKFPLSRYPRLRDYVGAHYRSVEVSAGVVLYRRAPEPAK
ncbi:MAG: hypothetical protein ABJA82_11405 [Myxococcales bacterium]